MKKIICLLFTFLIVLSCSIDGNKREAALESESRAYAPWVLCPTTTCGNHRMGLHQTHTYEHVKGEVHREGKCSNCKREFYHKKDYTIWNTKHQCVMSGGCGYTTYSTQTIDKKCSRDPNEGRQFDWAYAPVCTFSWCSNHNQRMVGKKLIKTEIKEEYLAGKDCLYFCQYKRYDSKHVKNYTVKTYSYHCEGTVWGTSTKCGGIRSDDEKYLNVCHNIF